MATTHSLHGHHPLTESTSADRHTLERKLEAIGWGLFFLWFGFALVADISEAVGLTGVAVIVLGMQMFRGYVNVAVEGFWVFIGFCFLLGGLWQLLNVTVSLAPILLMLLGAALLIAALRPVRPSNSESSDG